MNARDKEIFRNGFMTALAVADGYGRAMAKAGKPDLNEVVQVHVVMAEKCFDDILVNVLDTAESSADMVEAVKQVVEEGWR